MSNYSMSIITVFYKKDLGHLLFQAKSFIKNWKGNKEWILIPEDGGYSRRFVIEHIKPIMVGWNIIIPELKKIDQKELGGWWRQQIFKLWAASEVSNNEYSLILDTKNFIINPINENWFFENNGKQKVRVFSEHTGTNRHHDQWLASVLYFGGDKDKKVENWSLSPWVWRKDIVQLTIEQYNIRGCDIYNSDKIPSWEFDAYWFFAQDMIKWENSQEFGYGIYEESDMDRITDENIKFLKTGAFWSFHRRMKNNSESVKLNFQILSQAGIINEFDIKIWKLLNDIN